MTTEIKYCWPNDFTEKIPPEDATPACGFVFRLVDNLPPTADDFLQTREENPNRNFNSEHAKCLSYGVSIWSEKDQLKAKQRKFRKALGNKKVVSGVLVPELGKANEPQENSHRTLWKQVDAKPHLHINNDEAD